MIVFVMAAGLIGCSSSDGGAGAEKDTGITGVWKSIEVSYNGETMTLEEYGEAIGIPGYSCGFTINDDGTVTIEESAPGYGTGKVSGKWATSGDGNYVFTIDGDYQMMKLENGRLYNADPRVLNGAVIYFEKQ